MVCRSACGLGPDAGHPLWLALLIHGLFLELVAWGCWWWHRVADEPPAGGSSEEVLRRGLLVPLTASGAVSSALAVAYVLAVNPQTIGEHAVYAAMIAATWAIAGFVGGLARLISASYVAATVAIGFAVAAVAAHQPWPEPVLGDLRHVQWQVIVLALWCAVTTAVCRIVPASPASSQLLQRHIPHDQRVLLACLVVVLVGLGIIGCYPGVLVELGIVAPDSSLAQDPWHAQAYQIGSWLALASVALALVVALARRVSDSWIDRGRRRHGSCAAVDRRPLGIRTRSGFGYSVGVRDLHVVLDGLDCGASSARQLGTATLGSRRRTAGHLEHCSSRFVLGRWCLLGVGAHPPGRRAIGAGCPWGGPLAETWFAQLSPVVSYALPLAMLVVAMLVLAVREGSAVFALLGALVMECLIAMCVDMHTVATGAGRSFDWSVAMLQWTAIGMGSYGLVWLGLSRWIARNTPETQRSVEDAADHDPRERPWCGCPPGRWRSCSKTPRRERPNSASWGTGSPTWQRHWRPWVSRGTCGGMSECGRPPRSDCRSHWRRFWQQRRGTPR